MIAFPGEPDNFNSTKFDNYGQSRVVENTLQRNTTGLEGSQVSVV